MSIERTRDINVVPIPSKSNDGGSNTSSFRRRITRIPSPWVRNRPIEPPPAHSPSSSSFGTRNAPRHSQPTAAFPVTMIPPAPALPPPPPPIHPLASRLTLGVGVFKGRNRTSVNLSAGPNDYPESSLSVPNPRRRSVSSPSPQTPRPHHHTPRSETQSSHLGGDSNSATISKLDLISHFEAITQLNLKMESGEELTAEDLGHALRYLFSRYHGVLDSVGVFKARLEEENAELRTRVDTLQQKLRISDTEVSRLRSLLAHYDVSHRLSSESASTVQGYQRTSCSQSASTSDGLDFSAATVSPTQSQSSAD